MDEQTKEIIQGKLREWGTETVDQKKLVDLREAIYNKTGKNKFVPYRNLRKWIKMVKKDLAQAAKLAATVGVVRKPETRALAPSPTVAPIVFDRVYLQTISFEIAGIRRSMERISQQLSDLEKQLDMKKSSSKEEE